jgi:hypothetical protein
MCKKQIKNTHERKEETPITAVHIQEFFFGQNISVIVSALQSLVKI